MGGEELEMSLESYFLEKIREVEMFERNCECR